MKDSSSSEDGVKVEADGGKRPEIEHKLYFFQMPVITPSFKLTPEEEESQRAARLEKARIKQQEKELLEATNSSSAFDGAMAPAPKGRGRPSATAAAAAVSKQTTHPATAEDLHQQYPQGQIGKLRVHKSGRLTMLLGSVVMEVSQGTLSNFLQDVVVMDPDAQRSHLIGQVTRKMIVTPDVTSLLDGEAEREKQKAEERAAEKAQEDEAQRKLDTLKEKELAAKEKKRKISCCCCQTKENCQDGTKCQCFWPKKRA